MQKIIIYLNADNLAQASWTIVSESGGIQKTVVQGDLHELSAYAHPHEVVVIAPAEDVLLTEAKLPKLTRSRLLQALPFALEEQLLTELNELHFAMGDYQANGTLPVAIVTKQKITAWLAALANLQLFPSAILPAALAVPKLENCWNIFISDNTAIARTSAFSGFTCDKNNLNELIKLEFAAKTQHPQAIYINNYTNASLVLSINNANIIEKNLPAQQFTEDLALKITPATLNLLQGAYLARHKPSQNKKIWQIAGYLLLAWLGLTLFANLVSFGILHHQTAELDNSIQKIYHRNFPNASTITAPKERMTEKLNNLLSQGDKNRLLFWLSGLGKSLPELDGLQIKQLDYRNNLLSLEFTAANFDQVDKLINLLTGQGMTVKQQNVSASGTGSQVKGTLLISGNKS